MSGLASLMAFFLGHESTLVALFVSQWSCGRTKKQKREDSMNTKINLDEKEVPRQWYNIAADLPSPLPPPLHPGTMQPVGPDDLAPIFPMNLIEQEVSNERWIDIPEPVLERLLLYRPTPLYRARRLEQFLGTPARIYVKAESVSPAGSHKP